jgi:cell division protein FtsL
MLSKKNNPDMNQEQRRMILQRKSSSKPSRVRRIQDSQTQLNINYWKTVGRRPNP